MGTKKKRKNSNYNGAEKAALKAEEAAREEKARQRKNIIIAVVALAVVACAIVGMVILSNWLNDSCKYSRTRDIEGRDVTYVEFSVKDHGKFVVMLDATTAPTTVKNFLSLVNSGFYDGLTFHRIIDNFMIQGGDPDGNGMGGLNTTIKGEFDNNGHKNDIKHIRGVISMARSDDPDSASCQFFICNADYPSLDGNYAAFGYVVEGMSVIDSITEYGIKHTTNGVIKDKTKQPVIEYIKVIERE